MAGFRAGPLGVVDGPLHTGHRRGSSHQVAPIRSAVRRSCQSAWSSNSRRRTAIGRASTNSWSQLSQTLPPGPKGLVKACFRQFRTRGKDGRPSIAHTAQRVEQSGQKKAWPSGGAASFDWVEYVREAVPRYAPSMRKCWVQGMAVGRLQSPSSVSASSDIPEVADWASESPSAGGRLGCRTCPQDSSNSLTESSRRASGSQTFFSK